jgi:SIR2-like domain
VQTQDSDQVRELREHLEKAGTFGHDVADQLRRLAVQLLDKDVLPLIGAGGSVDCGMLLASKIGEELLAEYCSDPRFAPPTPGVKPDLGEVAEEIFMKTDQQTVVEVLGLPDATLWPPAETIDRHFCSYNVLARLARERLFAQAVSLNYDCGYEAGLYGEGFLLAPDTRAGRTFPDHATVMADKRSAGYVTKKGSFLLRKIHGCAQRYRDEMARDPTSAPENAIIVRRTQLQNWVGRGWARRALLSGAQENVLMLIGFSGSDANIVGALTELLDDTFKVQDKTGDPRVVVINHSPLTSELRGLAFTGLGGAALGADKVALVETSQGTNTAALLLLLAEMLAHRLDTTFTSEGYVLPSDPSARLATLVLAAPVMLRWSFLLRPREPDAFVQGINLHEAAERGYVPLLDAPSTTARALRRRAELRAALGHRAHETADELIANHGFVVDAATGLAYLPTGLDDGKLEDACRASGPLSTARRSLSSPKLTCIIVGDGPGGFNLTTGKTVDVPYA